MRWGGPLTAPLIPPKQPLGAKTKEPAGHPTGPSPPLPRREPTAPPIASIICGATVAPAKPVATQPISPFPDAKPQTATPASAYGRTEDSQATAANEDASNHVETFSTCLLWAEFASMS